MKRFWVFVIICVVALGIGFTVFRFMTREEILYVNQTVFEVNRGETKKIELVKKNLKAGHAPKAEITIEGCIIAHRHVHMNTKEATELGIKDKQPCTLKVPGIKGGTLNAVFKVSDDGFFETHIDTDEAAAFALNSGDIIDLEY